MPSAARRAATPALLLLLTIGFYWKVTLTQQFSWLEVREHAFQTMPALDFQARTLHKYRLPLWSQFEDGGADLAGRFRLGALNPLTYALALVPLKDGHLRRWGLEWWWVLLHWLSVWSAYALARHLGAHRATAILGGVAYGLGGFAGAAVTPQWIAMALWLPVAVRMHLRGRSAWCGAALGMAMLSGEVVAPLLLAAVLVAACVAAKRIWPAAAMAGMFLLVSAPAWLVAGSEMLGTWNERPNLYCGAVVLVLAVAGIGSGWSRPEVRLLGAITGAGIIATAAAPAAVALVYLGLCGLAVVGVETWLESKRNMWLRRALAGLGLAVLAGYMVAAVMKVNVTEQRPVMTAIAVLLAAAVFYGWERGGLTPRSARAALVGLVLLEAGLVSTFDWTDVRREGGNLRTVDEQHDMPEFFRYEKGWFRVEVDERAVPYRFGDWFGYDRVRPANDSERRRLGVRYWVGTAPAHGATTAVWQSKSGLRVFRNLAIRQALTVEPEGCAAGEDLRVESRAPTFVVARASLRCNATLVMGERWAPGWKAYVDRHPATLLETPYGLRAVALQAGEHRVEFRYRPWPLYGAAGMWLAGLVLAFFIDRRPHTRGL